MNNVINKVLLAGDKFTPEMHLIQQLFILLVDLSFDIKKELIDTRYIYT